MASQRPSASGNTWFSLNQRPLQTRHRFRESSDESDWHLPTSFCRRVIGRSQIFDYETYWFSIDPGGGLFESSPASRMLRDVAIACLVLVSFSLRLSAQKLTDEANVKACRLAVSHDQQALFVPAWVVAEEMNQDRDAVLRMIEQTVDVHANAKVDVLFQRVFARFSTGLTESASDNDVVIQEIVVAVAP